jgi:quercetin dioxygenase-like cupin family protein/transcriptional regulator with XRE-family HTH domain
VDGGSFGDERRPVTEARSVAEADRVSPPPRAVTGSSEASEAEMRTRLGNTIRTLRRRNGLTLVQLAALAELSHPFLSQLERGLARPSMSSLHRIARALGTTQPALMSMNSDAVPDRRVGLVRADTGIPVDNPGGVARSLVTGSRAIYPILFEGAFTDFGPYYSHPGDEFIYVLAGVLEVELDGEGQFVLATGDTLYYPGGVPHRWRAVGDPDIRALLVQEAQSPTH